MAKQKKLVIIISQEESDRGGTVTRTEKIGDESLWKEVRTEVLQELLIENR